MNTLILEWVCPLVVSDKKFYSPLIYREHAIK